MYSSLDNDNSMSSMYSTLECLNMWPLCGDHNFFEFQSLELIQLLLHYPDKIKEKNEP